MALGWTQLPNVPFTSRYQNGIVYHNGKIIVGPGVNYTTSQGNVHVNDMWASADGGQTWTQINANVEFAPRRTYAMISFNGALYAVGGNIAPDPVAGFDFVNDVWISTNDGASWTKIRNDTGSTPNGLFYLRQRGNEVWIFGGGGLGSWNEVHKTTDLINWTKVGDAGADSFPSSEIDGGFGLGHVMQIVKQALPETWFIFLQRHLKAHFNANKTLIYKSTDPNLLYWNFVGYDYEWDNLVIMYPDSLYRGHGQDIPMVWSYGNTLWLQPQNDRLRDPDEPDITHFPTYYSLNGANWNKFSDNSVGLPIMWDWTSRYSGYTQNEKKVYVPSGREFIGENNEETTQKSFLLEIDDFTVLGSGLAVSNPTKQTAFVDSIADTRIKGQFTVPGFRGSISILDVAGALNVLHRLPVEQGIGNSAIVEGSPVYLTGLEDDSNAELAPLVDGNGANIALFRPKSFHVNPTNGHLILTPIATPNKFLVYSLLSLVDNASLYPFRTITLPSNVEVYCVVEGTNFLYTVEKQSDVFYLRQREKISGELVNSYTLGESAGGFSLNQEYGFVYLVWNADWDNVVSTQEANPLMLFSYFTADLRLRGTQVINFESATECLGRWDINQDESWATQGTSRMWWTSPIFAEGTIYLPMGVRVYRFTPTLSLISKSGTDRWVNGDYWLAPEANDGSHIGKVALLAGGYNQTTQTIFFFGKVDAPSELSANDRLVYLCIVASSLPDTAGSSSYVSSIQTIFGGPFEWDEAWAVVHGKVELA